MALDPLNSSSLEQLALKGLIPVISRDHPRFIRGHSRGSGSVQQLAVDDYDRMTNMSMNECCEPVAPPHRAQLFRETRTDTFR